MYAIPNPFCAPADACPPRTVLSLSRPPVFTRRIGPQGSGLPKLPVSAPSSRMGSFPAPFPLLLASGDPHLGPDAAALHLLAIETGYDSLPWPLTPSLPRRPASLLSFLLAHPARGPVLARRPEARGCRRNARLGGGALCVCVLLASIPTPQTPLLRASLPPLHPASVGHPITGQQVCSGASGLSSELVGVWLGVRNSVSPALCLRSRPLLCPRLAALTVASCPA